MVTGELAMASPTRLEVGLAVRDVSVRFGPTRALSDVSFAVSQGTIHALLGGNGSGKSTLIKVIAGIQRADHGGVLQVGPQSIPVQEHSPETAWEAGLRFVHQDLGIFHGMSVAENVALYTGYPKTAGARISWRRLYGSARDLLDRFEIEADPHALVEDLRPATQTMLAIARALADDQEGSRILVLDEPTASLPAHEVDLLFDSLRRSAARGQTVVFVSHRLKEVLSFANALTVLRDGQVVASRDVQGTSEDDVVEMMAGTGLVRHRRDTESPFVPRDVVAQVTGLSAGPVRDIDLTVRSGEIVGLAGLLGSGRTSTLRAIFGDLKVRRGSIAVGAEIGPFSTPAKAIKAGVAFVPEDRRSDAAFLTESVADNMSIVSIAADRQRLRVHRGVEDRRSREMSNAFNIKMEGMSSLLYSLSGGNQQKVILARWMRRRPKLLLLDEPTQGVDVMAREDIYSAIRSAASEGTAVLVSSSDVEELTALCTRIVILAEGRVIGELCGDEVQPDRVHRLIHHAGTEEFS